MGKRVLAFGVEMCMGQNMCCINISKIMHVGTKASYK